MRKILIVDDEPAILKILDTTLTCAGYSTAIAKDGVEGMETFNIQQPDIVVTDIKMPRMDGIELLKKIKKISQKTEVILVTGFADAGTAVLGLKSGADAYLTKPIDLEELELTIEHALKEQEIFRANELEMLITSSAMQFINFQSVDINKAVSESLKRYGELLGVDSCIVSLLSGDGNSIEQSYEWHNEISKHRLKKSKDPLFSNFSFFKKELIKGELVSVSSLSDLPASLEETKAVLKSAKVKSILIIPIMDGGKFYGVFSLSSFKEERYWSEGESNHLRTAAGIFSNVFKNRKVFRNYEKSEEHFSSLVQAANEAIISCNTKGDITFCNMATERMFGYSQEEIMNRSLVLLISKKNENNHIKDIQKFFSTDRAAIILDKIATYGLKKDKSEFPIELSLSSWSIKNEIFFTVIVHDDSERKRNEAIAELNQQQLIQADKMASLGVMVSGVAHEINNPNNFIMFNTPMVKQISNDIITFISDKYEKTDDIMLGNLPFRNAVKSLPKLLDGISDGALRIKRIVDKLKDFSRYNKSGKAQPYSINAILKTAINLLDSIIRKSTNRFEVSYGEEIPDVPCNSQEIEQVLVNLIVNSCQAVTDKEKKICVFTSYDKTRKRIVVKIDDQGIGISKQNLKKIMDPFFTTKRESGGTGLGLSVSYGIVESHGGTLKFNSEVDKGTTAILTLQAVTKVNS